MKQRIITALIIMPIVLTVVFSANSVPVFLLAIALAYLGTDELCRMFGIKFAWTPHIVSLAFAGTGFFLKDHYFSSREKMIWILCILFFSSIAITLYFLRNRADKRVFLPSIVWLIAPMMGLLLLHFSVPKPDPTQIWVPNPLLMALVPIWIGDTTAIFVGKRFGKNKIAPQISPKKTWEGSVANLLACVIAAAILGPSIGLTLRQAVMIGLVCGVFGQLGDLYESALKRSFDAKDSGSLLPGHGGILDRIDSMLMPALPVAILVLYYN